MKPLKNNVSTQAHRLALWLAPLALLSLLAGPVFAEDFCQSGHDAYGDDEQVRVEAGHAVHWRESQLRASLSNSETPLSLRAEARGALPHHQHQCRRASASQHGAQARGGGNNATGDGESNEVYR